MKTVSGILLNGGKSTRMGRDKAALDYDGVSFLQHQINKLRRIGIQDIVIAGGQRAEDGTSFVPDPFPDCGPLGGIAAGLSAIKNPSALVLAVDTPLVPEDFLQTLIERHTKGITVASFGGKLEPLIGLYDKSLAELCAKTLRAGRHSVRSLFSETEITTVDYSGDPGLLLNCNTPYDYEVLINLFV